MQYRSEELTFSVKHSDRRKTLGITVDRDGSLHLHLPKGVPQDKVDAFVREKRVWVYTKLAEKEMLTEAAYQSRQFVNGEGFTYLGRSYRLLLEENAPDALKLKGGRFVLDKRLKKDAYQCFVDWYRSRALERLEPIVDEYSGRVGDQPAGLRVLDLSNRWASCSDKGVLNFHWKIMQLPMRFVRYIVAHEVVHLKERHHNQQYWSMLERVFPDCAEVRTELQNQAARYLRLD